MKFLMILTVGLMSISAWAKGHGEITDKNFKERQTQMLQHMDQKAEMAKKHRACVEKAKDAKSLRACKKDKRKAHKAWKKSHKKHGGMGQSCSKGGDCDCGEDCDCSDCKHDKK